MTGERRFDPVVVASVEALVEYVDSLRTLVLCPDEATAAAARTAIAASTAAPGLYEVRVAELAPAGTIYLIRKGLLNG